MKENEILEEIHHYRAEHARDCDYDIHKIFQQIRKGTEKLKAEGWQVVSPGLREAEPSCALHEEAPGEKQ